MTLTMTVLIVDDESYMVDYIKNLVEWDEYGFDRVLTAGGGSLARDLIDEYEPELLITDVKMPRISGLDLAQWIYEKKYRTRTIIISGYSEFDYARQALRYGVAEYLVKPVLKEDFVEMLERISGKVSWKKKEAEAGEGFDGARAADNKEAVIASVKNYINENPDKNLSLELLGELVHLHPAYLSKIFKEVADVNLSSYITDVKMQKAAGLLEGTDMKIYEVMERIGYQKSQYFSKLFKEKYGVTPKEYRRQKRQYRG